MSAGRGAFLGAVIAAIINGLFALGALILSHLLESRHKSDQPKLYIPYEYPKKRIQWIPRKLSIPLLFLSIAAGAIFGAIKSTQTSKYFDELVSTMTMPSPPSETMTPSETTTPSETMTPSETTTPSGTMTPSSIPTVAPTQTQIPTPQGKCTRTGELILNEDFSDNFLEWFEGLNNYPNAKEELRIQDGIYQYSANFLRDATTYTFIPETRVKDFFLSFSVVLIEIPDNASARIAVVFRHDSSGNFYRIRLSTEGDYAFDRWEENSPKPIIGWTSADDLTLSEGSPARISIIADGFLLSFCVDDRVIFTHADPSINQSGMVGFGLSGGENATIVAEFDNINLINLGK